MTHLENFQNIVGRINDGGGFVEGESVLEERFWDLMNRTRYKLEASKQQFEIGPYRVDSIFNNFGEAVVIELDGAAFHTDADYDRRRDEYLCQFVSSVIRIPFRAIWDCPNATFGILAHWYRRFQIPRNEAIRLETSTKTLMEIVAKKGNLEVYAIGADCAHVGKARRWDSGESAHRITIRRGVTDQTILERING